MKSIRKLKTFAKSAIILIAILIWGFGLLQVMAMPCNYYMEIRFQGRVKDTDQSDTENAVPQGMAGNGNTVYLLKTRKSTQDGVADRDYIIKILNANSSSPKVVLPDNAIGAGHGNGMTYYNGYLYIASGEDYDAIYRVQETNDTTTSWDPSTEWTNGKGTAHYKKEKMTVNGLSDNEDIRNIAHYTGNYFIVCLRRKYEDMTHTLTYGVFELNDTTFTLRKRFTVVKEETYKAIQDIEYKDGYLWIVLHDSDGTKNHIHLAELPTSYSELEDGQTYNVKKTLNIDKNEAGRADTRNELESIYVYGSNVYTWSNISSGWYETFCRYSRFPNGVSISSVTTKSKTSLEVKWNAVSNADKYRIDRREDSSDQYVTIATIDSSNTSYTDTGLTAGTKYYYRVYGVNSAGTSPRKNGVPGVTRTTTPKVSSVRTISETTLNISWTGVTGAKKYIVCRKKEGAGEGWENYGRIAETTVTEYMDRGLESNTKYYYGIVAVTETGVESGNPNDNGNPGEENRGSGTTLGKYAIDLNLILDGQEYWELAECGTADIYINGNLVADDVSEYWKEWAEGTSYEVKDIKANTNYRYDGIKGGSLSGTVGKGAVDLRLIFSTHMAVTGVKLNKSSLVLREGEPDSLTAIVEPSNAENQNVSWSSSNTGVATVDSSGRITTLKTGNATITVKTADGNKTASCEVTVKNPDPVNLTDKRTIADGEYRIRWLGTGLVWDIPDHSDSRGPQLEARKEDASDQYQVFSFVYQDGGYYTIQNKGSGLYVGDGSSGTEAGNPIIQWTATGADDQLWQPVPLGGNAFYITPRCATNRVADVYGNQQTEGSKIALWVPKGLSNQTFELVPVSISVTGISLNSDHREMEIGEKDRLAAFVEPENATDKSVTWDSSDSSVVIVDSDGNIEARKEGTATVTVTTNDGGKKAACRITVNESGDPGPGPGPNTGLVGRISAASVSGSVGTTVSVPVMLDENPGIIGLNVNMSYDDSKVRLVKVESGELLDGSSMSGNYAKNPYKLSFSNETSTENIEGTGVLATAFFEILEDAGEGDSEIEINFEEAYDKDLNEVSFETVNGKIAVQSYVPGDVNRDGQVKLNDAILLRRYVAGWDVDIDLLAADVNRDGQVKLNDAIILRRFVAGWDVELK